MSWLAWLTLAATAVGICVALRRPVVGLLVYLWLDFMRPHDIVADAAWFRPMLLVGTVTVVSTVWQQRSALLGRWRTLLPFLVLLAVVALSALLGTDPQRSAVTVVLASKGILLMWMLLVLADRDEPFEAGVWVIALSALCLAAAATLQGLERGVMNAFERSNAVLGPGAERGGPLSDNNDLARVLATSIPLWWLLATAKDGAARWRYPLGILGCVGTAVGVVFTFSRGGFLALLAGLAVVMRYYQSWPRVALSIVLCLGVLLAVAPREYGRRIVSIAVPGDNSFLQRVQIWQAAVAVVRGDPILGSGPGTFRPGDRRAPHNIFVEVLAESGFIGLLAYLWALTAVFSGLGRCAAHAPTNDTRRASLAVGASLMAYLVASLALSGPYQTRMFELIGLALALDARTARAA